MDREEVLRIVKEAREKGERPDLSEANLRWTNLHSVDLSEVNLNNSDLIGADFNGADLSGADMRFSDLTYADLRRANLSGAILDLGSWPLSCSAFSLGKTDDRLTAQLVRHALEVAKANDSEYGREVFEALKKLDRFHEYRSDVFPVGE